MNSYLENRPKALPSLMEQWVNAIISDTPMTVTIQDGRNLTELMQAAYISAEQGKAIDLPL
jgi:predicted dehydrogenase